MKKISALVLAIVMVLSLAACGSEPAPASSGPGTPPASTSPSGGTTEPGEAQSTPGASQPEGAEPSATPDSTLPSDAELSAWLKTKTGKFYSQFDGRMYMEYEMEYEGTKMTVVSATNGDKSYSESKIDGQSSGVSVMDGEYMYIIDHAGKTVIKMSLSANVQEMTAAIISEGDVNPAEMVSGSREIDGKTYDTEEWNIDGAKSIMCFDGGELAYMIGELEGDETVMKIIKTDDKVDDSLFEIPADYQVISY